MRIEEAWKGPLGHLLAPLGWLFGLLAAIRVFWRRGRGVRPPFPTVSIGNLSVGGTGKTPLLLYILKQLEAAGLRTAVLSRGHGGDEGRLLARRAPTCRLVEDPDRVAGLRQLEAAVEPPDLLLLDDGFQHLRLKRDLDIVMIDALEPFGRCLPAGPLRERPSALARADRIVLSRADLVDETTRAELWAKITDLRRGRPTPILEGTVVPTVLRNLNSGEESGVERLQRSSVFLASGVGRPASFRALVEAAGAEVLGEQHFPDHHAFWPGDVAGWAEHPMVLVTEKDGVKLSPFAPPNVWEVVVDWVFTEGAEEFERAIRLATLEATAGRVEPFWGATEAGS